MTKTNKVLKSPRAAVYPAPAALVSAYSKDGKPNAMTAAWISNICAVPPSVVVGIRDNRYTHKLIKDAQVFGVNIPAAEHKVEADYFGVVSGRDVDKFEKTGLSVFKGSKVDVPLIQECPINVECKVTHWVNVGSHDAIIGEVLAVHYNENMLNEKGSPDILLGDVLAYGTGGYYTLKEKVGTNGFSRKKMQ